MTSHPFALWLGGYKPEYVHVLGPLADFPHHDCYHDSPEGWSLVMRYNGEYMAVSTRNLWVRLDSKDSCP